MCKTVRWPIKIFHMMVIYKKNTQKHLLAEDVHNAAQTILLMIVTTPIYGKQKMHDFKWTLHVSQYIDHLTNVHTFEINHIQKYKLWTSINEKTNYCKTRSTYQAMSYKQCSPSQTAFSYTHWLALLYQSIFCMECCFLISPTFHLLQCLLSNSNTNLLFLFIQSFQTWIIWFINAHKY